MKCENCGKNEVSFVYRSSINGRTEEHHLCQACAEKLGYTQKLFNRRPSMRDSFFGNDDFFGDFFSPMPSLLGRMNRMLESPFDDFFDAMPAIGAAPVQEVKEEKKDDLMSHEEQSRFSYLRQLNALKLEQKKAIHEENFERAAQLRDEIHKLEEAHKEAKELSLIHILQQTIFKPVSIPCTSFYLIILSGRIQKSIRGEAADGCSPGVLA